MNNYEIVIQGHIDKRRFRDMAEIELEKLPSGETKITCVQFDQAALHAVLTKIYDLGLDLQRLQRI
ncbi:MAG TPA: hypothetical protein VNT57_07015 [Desulfobacteria bacterium]|nr:hypothetical protein [Desulfobacteria bacterium]